jgi:hypothetical protein
MEIAICNNTLMMLKSLHRPIACNPRPWLSRLDGECAFPVDGEGPGMRACCNPCATASYCAPHAAAMREPAIPSADEFEREIMAFLEQGSRERGR